MGLTTRFSLLSDSCWLVEVGRSLWREDGSVVYNCCWPSPAHSFWSPVELLIIFCCPHVRDIPFPSPPTTRSGTMESEVLSFWNRYNCLAAVMEETASKGSVLLCVGNHCNYHGNQTCCPLFVCSVSLGTCVAKRYLAMAHFTLGSVSPAVGWQWTSASTSIFLF
jgi:hypothetical protein